MWRPTWRPATPRLFGVPGAPGTESAEQVFEEGQRRARRLRMEQEARAAGNYSGDVDILRPALLPPVSPLAPVDPRAIVSGDVQFKLPPEKPGTPVPPPIAAPKPEANFVPPSGPALANAELPNDKPYLGFKVGRGPWEQWQPGQQPSRGSFTQLSESPEQAQARQLEEQKGLAEIAEAKRRTEFASMPLPEWLKVQPGVREPNTDNMILDWLYKSELSKFTEAKRAAGDATPMSAEDEAAARQSALEAYARHLISTRKFGG